MTVGILLQEFVKFLIHPILIKQKLKCFNLQIFNEFNARKPDEMNVFRGVTKNRLFMGIVGVTFILQVE